MINNKKHPDNKTVNELWLQYEPYVRKLCKIRLQAYPDHIDDCVSDTFLVLIEALKDEKEILNPKAFLYSVAANKTADVFRYINKADKIVLSFSHETEATYNIDYENEIIDDEKLIAVKEKVLALLTDEDRALLKKKYTDKFTVSQIAEIHGTSENNIYQKLFRLRKKTQKIIKELLNNT